MLRVYLAESTVAALQSDIRKSAAPGIAVSDLAVRFMNLVMRRQWRASRTELVAGLPPRFDSLPQREGRVRKNVALVGPHPKKSERRTPVHLPSAEGWLEAKCPQ